MADLTTAIAGTIHRYVEAFSNDDRATWLGCFTADATMEDPVGSPPKRGHDEIGTFYDQSRSSADAIQASISGAPIVCGAEASFTFDIVVTVGGSKMGMSVIDVMTFDDDARITSQRAFVDFSQLAPLDS
ncbi:MAG TPA: nuclear transport factor 2 family protein [Acidimicrobiales bacterium]|jgi:steroid delta-isomerase